MRIRAYQYHMEDEVLGAPSLQLVQMLYRGALDSIASARRYLRLGDIRARSRAVDKAMAIVTELSLSLNHRDGGDLSRRLAELYGYVQRRLIEANTQQADPPLAEVERLMSMLLEGWNACADGAGRANELASQEPVSCAY